MRCLAIVRFPAPPGLSGSKLRAVLEAGVPRYQGIPGLHRKYFAGNDSHGAGIYEWESRSAADAFYDAAWHERLRTVYGAVPQIEFFEVDAVVDNDSHTMRIDV